MNRKVNSYVVCFCAVLLGLCAIAFWPVNKPLIGQTVRVTGTAAPLVVSTAGDLANLALVDGTVVFLANASGGALLIYDADGTQTVNNDTVYNGPDSVGRFITFSLAGIGGVGEGSDMWENAEFVVGTGTAATDTTALQAAVDAIEALGNGVVYISGTVSLNADITVTEAVSLVGIPGTNATIQQNDDAGTIYYNQNYSPFASGSALTATAAFDDHIVVPTGTLDEGEYVFVWSENPLLGCAHSDTYGNYPGEIHRIHEVRQTDSGNDYLVFDDFIVDALDYDPKYVVVTMLKDITIRGLRFTWAGTTAPDEAAIDFRRCAQVRVEDCTWVPPAPNELGFYYCYDVVITNCSMGSKEAYDTGEGYHVVAGPVNNFTFSDSFAYGSRHVFTTSAQSLTKSATFTVNAGTDECTTTSVDLRDGDVVTVSTTGVLPAGLAASTTEYIVIRDDANTFRLFADHANYTANTPVDITDTGTGTHTWTCKARVGTPRNVLITNIVAKQNGDTGSTLVPFDTHAEGWGITFQNCLAAVPTEYRIPASQGTINSNRAFNVRARNVIIKDCRVQGSGLSNGVLVFAGDCQVLNTSFEDCWYGVRLYDDTSGSVMSGASGLRVHGCLFQTLTGPAVSTESVGNHVISFNMMKDVCTQTSTLIRGMVNIANNAGNVVEIAHNYMYKGANKVGISGDATGFANGDLKLTGNTLVGYAANGGNFTANAGTDVCTSSSHQLVDNHGIQLTSTGTLPAGLSTATTYYLVSTTGSTFKLSATVGGAAIDITDAGTGTHSWRVTTDSGIEYRNTDHAAFQTTADAYNWTD